MLADHLRVLESRARIGVIAPNMLWEHPALHFFLPTASLLISKATLLIELASALEDAASLEVHVVYIGVDVTLLCS